NRTERGLPGQRIPAVEDGIRADCRSARPDCPRSGRRSGVPRTRGRRTGVGEDLILRRRPRGPDQGTTARIRWHRVRRGPPDRACPRPPLRSRNMISRLLTRLAIGAAAILIAAAGGIVAVTFLIIAMYQLLETVM